VKKHAIRATTGNRERSTQWCGVRPGDVVIVNTDKERRHSWVFVAHVRNVVTSEEWVEVRGGRAGEHKTRSFRCDVIFPASAKKNGKVRGLSLLEAPQLNLG
jgi:hypothetical protein